MPGGSSRAPVELLADVLTALSAGADPARLLHDTVAAAAQAGRAQHAVLFGLVEGVARPLAQTGAVPGVVADAADAALRQQRQASRTAHATATEAVAEPVMLRGRVIGSLAIGGMGQVDAGPLAAFASAAALVMSHRPSVASTTSAVEVLDVAAQIAADPDEARVLVRAFVAAERIFGAQAGLCALTDGDGLRIAHHRGIDKARLREASRLPQFRSLLASPGIRVDPPTHPVVSFLSDGVPTAVGLPLVAAGKRLGHLLLLLADAPDPPTKVLLESFATHVSLSLRSAEVHRRANDKEEQLASVVHSISHPIVVVDERGTFQMLNGAAAELFHIAEGFERGRPVTGRLGNPVLEGMLVGDGAVQAEVVVGTSEPRVYRATVGRVRGTVGGGHGRVLILDDITKDREAEQLKADFVAVIGHELRTPLTVMKGYLHLLEKGDALSAEAKQTALTALNGSTVRLERLVEDLLFAASFESSRPVLEMDDTDIGALLAERAGGRVVVKESPRPIRAAVDRPKLAQVLHHLVDNALKYSDGEVVLEAAVMGDEVEVSVTDSGPGIYSGDIPMLFERFRQLDGTSTRAHGGTGLGLYVCRRLVELQGGRIWCESRLGVGSRFAFRLPVRPRETPGTGTTVAAAG